jgi:hypothetical protein
VDSCPHCAAPLRPAATFCLACDRPVVDETSRLSVAEAVHVSAGRPLIGLLVVAGCLLVIGAATYGGVAFVHDRHAATRGQAVADVTRGTTLLIDAEAGRPDACRRARSVLAGPTVDLLRECLALVDHDPGARVDRVRVDRLRLHGTTGTAHVRATVGDATGTHTVDRVVALVHARRTWLMAWDGKPAV